MKARFHRLAQTSFGRLLLALGSAFFTYSCASYGVAAMLLTGNLEWQCHPACDSFRTSSSTTWSNVALFSAIFEKWLRIADRLYIDCQNACYASQGRTPKGANDASVLSDAEFEQRVQPVRYAMKNVIQVLNHKPFGWVVVNHSRQGYLLIGVSQT